MCQVAPHLTWMSPPSLWDATGTHRLTHPAAVEDSAALGGRPWLGSGAEPNISAYPVPTLELAPGGGRKDVQIFCNTCHSPCYITMQPPLPAATWEFEASKMNKADGAGIPEDTTRKIMAYLQIYCTPETRKEKVKSTERWFHCGAMPSTMKMRLFAELRRIGLIAS